MSEQSAGPQSWVGHQVTGAAAEPLGRVVAVFTDPTTGAATWAAVDRGAGSTTMVPLDGARAHGTGIRVPYDADQVRTAPPHDPTQDLDHQQAAALGRHYSAAARPPAPQARPPAPDTPAPSEGGWVVRNEEQLRVLTETVVTGRVRIRKRTVTEEQTFTVPVTREEISIEQQDVAPEERTAEPGARPAEQVLEIVRYEERVVITKEVVPVERIRIVRHVVTEPEIVRGVVRREVLDVDEDRTGPDRPPAG